MTKKHFRVYQGLVIIEVEKENILSLGVNQGLNQHAMQCCVEF